MSIAKNFSKKYFEKIPRSFLENVQKNRVKISSQSVEKSKSNLARKIKFLKKGGCANGLVRHYFSLKKYEKNFFLLFKVCIMFLNTVIYLPTKNSRNSVLFLCLQSGFIL